ncbi:hypothetical protein [Actinomadura coerulea]|uniref:hypothetical protein n=1 Tax=Actinomadura coerulea TaxID=46159 RepID=UPI00341B310C
MAGIRHTSRVLDLRRLMQLRLPEGLLDPPSQLVNAALSTGSPQRRGDASACQPRGCHGRERQPVLIALITSDSVLPGCFAARRVGGSDDQTADVIGEHAATGTRIVV